MKTLLPKFRTPCALLHPSAAILDIKELTTDVDKLVRRAITPLYNEWSAKFVFLREIFTQNFGVRPDKFRKKLMAVTRNASTLQLAGNSGCLDNIIRP